MILGLIRVPFVLKEGGEYLNFQDVYRKIAEDVNYLFSTMSYALKYDKTFRARVIEIISERKCKVKYKNIDYTVKHDISLLVGDTVWVKAPCNNWDALYIERKAI